MGTYCSSINHSIKLVPSPKKTLVSELLAIINLLGENSTEPLPVMSNKVGDTCRGILGIALCVAFHFKLFSCVCASEMSFLFQTLGFQ